MFRNALQEVRQHPGRMLATLIAIAISVAFMAGMSIFLATEKNGLATQFNRQISAADAVVIGVEFPMTEKEAEDFDPNKATQKQADDIKKLSGVEATEVALATGGTLKHGDAVEYVQLNVVPSEQFRWAKVTEGAWPKTKTEVALPQDTAKKMGATVGETLTYNGSTKVTLTAITDDPKSLLLRSGYIGAEGNTEVSPQAVLVKAKQGTTPDELVTQIKTVVKVTKDNGVKVDTRENYMQEQLNQLTGEVDVIRNILLVFAGIALVVGMIIIANTFTILITQRRRQIGLLRAIGAGTGQVRRLFLSEALITGIIGSLLGLLLGTGLAALGSTFTGSIFWGLRFPPAELGIEFLVGVLITVIAAIAPVWRTSSVKPLEALQPVLNADAAKKVSLVRAIICGVLAAIGLAFMVLSLVQGVTTDDNLSKTLATIGFAVLAAIFISIAVLGAAPLYVAGLIKLIGKVTGLTGPTARMATMNASRNPNRAAATAVALMLAIGLIVTLQVATSSVRTTVLKEIDENYPVDLTIMSISGDGFTADQQATIKGLPGVKASTTLVGGPVQYGGEMGMGLTLLTGNDQLRKVTTHVPDLADDEALVDPSMITQLEQMGLPKDRLELTSMDGKKKVTVKLKTQRALGYSVALVNEATAKQVLVKPVPTTAWIQLQNRDDFAQTMIQLQAMQGDEAHPVQVGGGASEAYLINQVLNVLLAIMTALLGVAVLIALVGVANTLGLSVIERTRESALLRALGMQKSRLRLMLWIEAVALALVGVLVGIAAGAFFAWLGVGAVFRAMGQKASDLTFSIDPWQTLGLLGIAVAAASLASILPGRRAANAAPTEALAAD